MSNNNFTWIEKSNISTMNMNSRLSAARIFDEESSTDSVQSVELKSAGKMKSIKRDIKSSPYKNERPTKPKTEYEKDPEILYRRQKQIDYGKNTAGYDNYLKQVQKNQRTRDHPKTPEKHVKYSRRGWDGLIKTWRHKLHEYDPEDYKQDNSEDEDKIEKKIEDIKKDFEETEKDLLDFI